VIGDLVSQLIGLFVDDELLAVGILVAVAVVALLAMLSLIPTWLAGLLLTVSLPAVLAASVVRSVRRTGRAVSGK